MAASLLHCLRNSCFNDDDDDNENNHHSNSTPHFFQILRNEEDLSVSSSNDQVDNQYDEHFSNPNTNPNSNSNSTTAFGRNFISLRSLLYQPPTHHTTSASGNFNNEVDNNEEGEFSLNVALQQQQQQQQRQQRQYNDDNDSDDDHHHQQHSDDDHHQQQHRIPSMFNFIQNFGQPLNTSPNNSTNTIRRRNHIHHNDDYDNDDENLEKDRLLSSSPLREAKEASFLIEHGKNNPFHNKISSSSSPTSKNTIQIPTIAKSTVVLPGSTLQKQMALAMLKSGYKGESEEDECVICMEGFDETNPRMPTLCGCGENKTYFHLPCLYHWIEQNNECPVCKKELTWEEF